MSVKSKLASVDPLLSVTSSQQIFTVVPRFSVFSLQILTKDSVTARVDAVVYFRIADPIAAVVKAENARDSTFRISQSTLRDVLGTKTLAELLAEREVISEQLGVSCGGYFS